MSRYNKPATSQAELDKYGNTTKYIDGRCVLLEGEASCVKVQQACYFSG